jgi:CheY-like chemotaxis protein
MGVSERSSLGTFAGHAQCDFGPSPGCLILDVRLPGQSGLDLQRELAAANRKLPIIFHYRGIRQLGPSGGSDPRKSEMDANN